MSPTAQWDLARFAKLDIDADESTISDMTRERLLWYAGRVADVVGATLDAFPGVKLVWRSMHWPSDKDAKVRTPVSPLLALETDGRSRAAFT